MGCVGGFGLCILCFYFLPFYVFFLKGLSFACMFSFLCELIILFMNVFLLKSF